MFNPVSLVSEDTHVPFAAVFRRDGACIRFHHQIIVTTSVGDQVTDGPNLKVMIFGVVHKIRQTRHFAVWLHDFADHRRWVVPCKASNIAARFGMSGPHQHTALTGPQWKDVARRGDVCLSFIRVDDGCDCEGAIPC